MMNQKIRDALNYYETKYKVSANSGLLKQLHENQDLVDRKNFEGHVTTSAYLISPCNQNVLVIYNLNLKIMIQPGGHLEYEDSDPLAGAKRELEEETGIKNGQYEILSNIMVDQDTHYIPENKKKREPEHFHHDLKYAFRLVDNAEIKLQEDEVSDFKWVKIEDFSKITPLVHQRLNDLLK